MYGGRGFGGTYFAQAGGIPFVPPSGGAVSPGGSGIPKDWLDRLLTVAPRDEEVIDLIALGVL